MMTHREAHQLIQNLRRQLLFATLARMLLTGIVGAGLLGALRHDPASTGSTLSGGLSTLWSAAILAVVVWVTLLIFSVRQVRASNRASAYIASGRLDLAEAQLKNAVRRFSLYRNSKLMACHNLAVVAHGQKCYQASAELCNGILSMWSWSRISQGLHRVCRILLADCHLFLGDTASASRVIESLSPQDPHLSLAEQLLLLPIELRCQIANAEYERAADSLPWKISRAELLDSPKAALAHALLAEACRQTGQTERAAFLQRRAELYHDLKELAEDYAVLRDSQVPASAPTPTSADNK